MSTALQRDDLAFESLYRLNRTPIYAYALSRLRHPADAEDVTQTTFMNAYCALRRGVAPRDDLQWLLAIARNVCRDKFRDTKRRGTEEPLSERIRLVQPEEPRFRIDEVFREISELHPRQQKILLMREFEGRSYMDIAAALGVTEGAVHTLLAHARRTLREELELGITCAYARLIALRNLNGVASIDERRALKRHLRRCDDCAVFVGQRPRKPLAQVIWFCTIPYRRLLAFITAPSAASAGSTAAVVTKVLTVTAVGTTAFGVTAKELGTGTHAHPPPAVPAPAHHRVVPRPAARSAAATPGTAGGAMVVRRSVHRVAAPAKPAATPLVLPQTVADTVSAAGPAVAAPGGAAPASPPATPSPATTPAPLPVSGSQVDPAPAPAPAENDMVPPPTDPVTAPATGADPVAAAGSDVASTPSTAEPPSQVPTTTPPGQLNTPGVPRGNGVGRDGTPPGQAAKADGTHGPT